MKNAFLVLLLLFAPAAFAANASPVTVTSTTVSGSTVTVNATAHGLVANQGFCNHTVASPYCGVVISATANAFTFTQANPVACSSSCGGVVPANKVIMLDTPSTTGPGSTTQGVNARYVCWSTTTQPLSAPGTTSTWKSSSVEENAAIAAGYFIETQQTLFVTTGLTLAQAQALMVSTCAGIQTDLASGVQPAAFYGDRFDTGWTQ